MVNPAVATALVSGAVSATTSAAAFLMGRAGRWKDFRRFGWVALTAAGGVWALGRQVGEPWWSASGPLLTALLVLYAGNTLA